jgi:hypothetical protein
MRTSDARDVRGTWEVDGDPAQLLHSTSIRSCSMMSPTSTCSTWSCTVQQGAHGPREESRRPRGRPSMSASGQRPHRAHRAGLLRRTAWQPNLLETLRGTVVGGSVQVYSAVGTHANLRRRNGACLRPQGCDERSRGGVVSRRLRTSATFDNENIAARCPPFTTSGGGTRAGVRIYTAKVVAHLVRQGPEQTRLRKVLWVGMCARSRRRRSCGLRP